jgi:hypothetical protein
MEPSQNRWVLWVLAALVLGATGAIAWRSLRWWDTYQSPATPGITPLTIGSGQGSFEFYWGPRFGIEGWNHFDFLSRPDGKGSYQHHPIHFFQLEAYTGTRIRFTITIGYGWILVLEALIFGMLLRKYRRRRERPEPEAEEAGNGGGVGGPTA